MLDSGSMVCHMQTPDIGNEATPCALEDYGTAACHDLAVLWFKVARDEKYFLQNQLVKSLAVLLRWLAACACAHPLRPCTTQAPIVLVTILSASAFFNDLDAYELRCTIMATSLLSQMALQAYVSASLPETTSVTYLHYGLYTSYALMGFGVFHIVIVSYGLANDFAAARRLNASPGDAAAKNASCRRLGGGSSLMSRLRMVATGHEGVQHWRMRLFYAEATIFRRLLDGKEPADAPIPELLYFPTAAMYVRRTRANAAVERMGTPFAAAHADFQARKDGVDAHVADAEQQAAAGAEDNAALGGEEYGHVAEAEVDHATRPYCPRFIWLRRALIDFDAFMRVGHLFIYCLVLAARYFEIRATPDENITCYNLTDFYGLPS